MFAWKIVLFSLCLALAAEVSAGEVGSTNPGGQKRGRIVVLGDSITAGYGLNPSEAYPAVLQQKIDAAGLPFEVVNAGLSGDTTAGGLRRLDWSLRGGADVLIVALGGNDGLRGFPPHQTASNLAGIIKRARVKVPDLEVIVAGMQMPGSFGREYVDAYRALFPQVASENRARLVPFLLEGVGGVAALNQPDYIHPTAAGQKRVAENVWKVLRPLLEQRRATTAAR
jgi:acyl-CoA thioesterase-1